MATLINHTAEIIKNLGPGKSRVMNTPEDFAAFQSINKHMVEVRREFLIKEAQSWESASKIVLNA